MQRNKIKGTFSTSQQTVSVTGSVRTLIKNRDISQLNIITEEEYIKGIEEITSDIDKNESIIYDLANMEMNGYKI